MCAAQNERRFSICIYFIHFEEVFYMQTHILSCSGVQSDILPGRFHGGLIVNWIRVRAISSFVDIFAGVC